MASGTIAVFCLLALVVTVSADYEQDVTAAVSKLSGACKIYASNVFGNLTEWSQADGCSSLTFSDAIKTGMLQVGCTEAEYNSVKDVVCATSQIPDSGGADFEQDVAAAINKLSGACKIYASNVFGKLSRWSQAFGCSSLTFSDVIKTAMLQVGCTEAEYNSVKDMICATSQIPDSGSADFEQDLTAAVNKLSGTCKKFAAIAFGALTLWPQADGCSVLTQFERFKSSALAVGCTEAEYNSCKDVFCGANSVIVLKRRSLLF